MKFNQHQYKLLSQVFADLGKAVFIGGIINLLFSPKATLLEQILYMTLSIVVSMLIFYNAYKSLEGVINGV